MKIAKDTVVSVAYKLSDAHGNLIEESDEPMVYLHGGYDGTFPKIEEALDGQEAGYQTQLQLEPQDAFGEYDPDLVKVEARGRFPEPLEVGMQFEGLPDGAVTPGCAMSHASATSEGRSLSSAQRASHWCSRSRFASISDWRYSLDRRPSSTFETAPASNPPASGL